MERYNKRWLTIGVYSRALGNNALRLVKRHAVALSRGASEQVASALAATLRLKSPTAEEFDNAWNRVTGGPAPDFPFATAVDYYEWASSHRKLVDVQIPFVAINAADDPVVHYSPKPANGWTAIAVTAKGGHLGWFERDKRGGKFTRWIRKPVLEWLSAAGTDMVHDFVREKAVIMVDGFVTEEGRPHLGCREIDIRMPHRKQSMGTSGLFQGL